MSQANPQKQARRLKPDVDNNLPGDVKPNWPWIDAGPLPDDLLGGAFSRLDAGLPLLLLPVRIETHYKLDASPPELRIRIYPDQVHINNDRPEASQVEIQHAKEFWTGWYGAKKETGKTAAWQGLVKRVGAKRAGYLARMLRPKQSKTGKLTFPTPPPTSTPPEPGHPEFMPKKWLAIGYNANGVQIFRVASELVAPDLRTGPDPQAATWEVSGGGLQVDDGLAWMVDYDRAVQVGMAITVPLTGLAAEATEQVDTLLVVGVQEKYDATSASTQLAALLDIHARTTGLDFVPQGTPTNNTEAAVSGWMENDMDPVDLAESALREIVIQTPGPKVTFDDNAAQLAAALGLSNAASLRRLAHGGDREATHSEYMRTVLFEAVFGTLLRELLDVGTTNGTSVRNMNAARTWFIQQVTGGAPVPAVRIGSQPYGILPVRRTVVEPELNTSAGQVERIVGLLIDVWRQSADLLPTLNSDQTDTSGEGEMETAIATILASQPHPARFFLRDLVEYIEGSTPMVSQVTYEFIMDTFDESVEPNHYLPGITEAALIYKWSLPIEYPGGFQSIDDQIDYCVFVQDTLRSQGLTGEVLDNGLTFMESLLNVLISYEKRQHPLRWLGLTKYEGTMGELNTTLVAGQLYGYSTEWGDIGLVQSPNAGEGETAADYLNDLHARFDARGPDGALGSSNYSLTPKPLLYQLLEFTLPLVPNLPATNKSVLEALDGLAELDADTLEWYLRETLGLGAHRLDAWATSLASERLARMRTSKPVGIQIGGYGWVTQLTPREVKRPSEGFIHAPSMGHATTAAMLRAGWHAHGTNDPLSPVAMNFDSARVRTASWLLDGVRQGQPLGDLLGYRFERSLHDRHADDQIHEVRQLVLNAQGKPNASTDQPVDGIELLDLVRGSLLGAVTGPVQDAIDELEATFDAVQDVSLFEAVHQLAAGNYERATAMLDSISTGSIAPPELRAPVTPRSAVSVEHRVVILLHPENATPVGGWVEGIRDLIAPGLESWLTTILPAASDIGFYYQEILVDGQPGEMLPLSLAQLGLSAMDAVYLAGDDPINVPAALKTLAAGAAGTLGAISIDPGMSDRPVSLADFTVLAAELRRLLETLRPLDARDLRPAATRGEADTDPKLALDAIQALILSFDRLGDDLDEAIQDGRLNDMQAAVSRMARLGISSGASPRDVAGATALMDLFYQRLNAVVAFKVDAKDRQPGLEARLAALLERSVPVLGQFNLAGTAGGGVVDVKSAAASPIEVDDWLDAVGRVRADVGKLTGVGLLSEIMGAGGLALNVGQDPLDAGEGWAATHRPAGAGRLSVVAVSGSGGPPDVGKPACGLFVDQWSDAVPSDQQISGVSFQFDAPSNRPPQAWLLAVPPDGEAWNLKLVTDTLLQTLEWAKLRAVGPEDLLDYGRAIPTTFAPGNVLNWPKET